MESAWLCVILNKSLCSKGTEVVHDEMRRLAGDSFIDFRFVDDEFDSDSYSFVKCRIKGAYMEKFRASHYIVSVLDSYDSPVYLEDKDVLQFMADKEPEVTLRFNNGDTVRVDGEGYYANLYGIVLEGMDLQSLVLFRFHTLSIQVWLSNEELVKTGSFFDYLKFPVTNREFLIKREKYPISREAKNVSSGECNRNPDREGGQK